MKPAARFARAAQTLIEVLVALAVLGILLGLASVWIQGVRERASQVSCEVHLRDLALAVHAHHGAKGTMPPYASGRPHELYGGWYMHLLPYVGHDSLHETLLANQVSVHKGGISIATTGSSIPAVKYAAFPEIVCASDPTRHGTGGDNKTNFLANWYALSDGIRGTYRRPQRFSSLSNGLSNVVLFAEAYSECAGLPRLALYSSHYHNFGITQEGLPSDDPWYAPTEYIMFQERPAKCDPWRTQTPHDVMHVALADGSVRSGAPSICTQTWKYGVKARLGTVPGSDW